MQAVVAEFLTANEVAELLRTSRPAVYAMVARGQIPGVVRIGRRVLVCRQDLLDWIDQKRVPSAGGVAGDEREGAQVPPGRLGGGHRCPPAGRDPVS